MTGQGQSKVESAVARVQVEIRSVNNRFLKVNVRCGESFGQFSPRIEKLVSGKVGRGSVNVNVRIVSDLFGNSYQLNETILKGYKSQLETIFGLEAEKTWGGIFQLPGVVEEEQGEPEKLEEIWPVVGEAVLLAVENLNQMRQVEGDAMVEDLKRNLATVLEGGKAIQDLAPKVAENYQNRLKDRINQLLEPFEVKVEPSDIVKEVGMFADRCDISEEIVRLESHIDQFHQLLEGKESQGRKLDFLTQEMFREINTIGSKANDKDISMYVVSIKAAVERIREMVQNIE